MHFSLSAIAIAFEVCLKCEVMHWFKRKKRKIMDRVGSEKWAERQQYGPNELICKDKISDPR